MLLTASTNLAFNRKILGVAAAALLVAGTTGCAGGSGSSVTDNWEPQAKSVASALTQKATSTQTVAPDPAMFDEPPKTVAGRAVVASSVSELRKTLGEAADQDGLDEPDCQDVTRKAAMELLAQAPDNQREASSAVCDLTKDGEKFGFVVLAGIDDSHTRTWYELGPDGTHQNS